MKNILVICAHPTDAVLGCGGTLALHADRGDCVRVVIMSDAWTSRFSTLEKARESVDLDVIEAQSDAALKTLGVTRVEYLRFPDNRFDVVPLLDLVKRIEKVKREYIATRVYTNSPYDLSVDQQKTFRAVLTAFRPQPGDNTTELLSFEVPSSTEWNIPGGTNLFAPNYFIDVTSSLDRKVRAFAQLSYEVRPWPHPRSVDAITYQAKTRGASVGTDAAETFMLMRALESLT